jgi:hypothetical protein
MESQRVQLLVGLAALSVASLMLHFKMHPPEQFLSHLWASLFSGTDAIVVTVLFLSRRTAVWGLLLNSFIGFLGIIMMSDLAIVSALEGWIKVSFYRDPIAWLLESPLPYILIVVADYVTGLALYKITVMAPK